MDLKSDGVWYKKYVYDVKLGFMRDSVLVNKSEVI